MKDVVAALIWDDDKFLICQRPEGKARALLWEFVGGKVEAGESQRDALIRECEEELAVKVNPEAIFMEVIHHYPDLSVRLILYVADITDGEVTAIEHNDIRWIRTDEIDDYDFCPADVDILQVLRSIHNKTEALLYAYADDKYKAFQASLIPTMDRGRILGVSIPKLRKLSHLLSYPNLGALPHPYYELDCLHGLLINKEKDPKTVVAYLDQFLPYVDNWAVCDLINPKCFANNKEIARMAADRWLDSTHPYTVRFGIGIYMRHFLEDDFNEECISRIADIQFDHYYVKMMIAWYLATALAKQYDPTIKVLESRKLHPWIHKKTIQKAIESFRIPEDKKAYIRSLR